jgi:hypothetical protein
MIITTNSRSINKQLNNIVNYSFGFLEGVDRGKKIFFNNLGLGVIQALSQYVDVQARSNPRALHHVYEWNKVGSPGSRLFNLTHRVTNLGLSVNSTFSQSRSVSENMNTPFYNKAKIMEEGIPVTISPKKSGVLRFNGPSGEVFTSKPIKVESPGGDEVYKGFESAVDEFMVKYFKQSFLRASGLYDYIKSPKIYKKNFKAGSKMGRSKGVETGFKWITNATIGVE